MFNLAISFIAAAALLTPSAVLGQDLSACVTNCTTNALSTAGCTSITDLQCVCSSTDFLTTASACISTDCPDQLDSAIAAQTAACAAVSNSTATDTATGTDVTGTTVAGVTTPVAGVTTTRAAGTTTPRPTTTGTSRTVSSSSTSTNSTGAGFHTASIASGVTLALFGAAFSLF